MCECTYNERIEKNHEIHEVGFGAWQNVGSGSVRPCWVRILFHLYSLSHDLVHFTFKCCGIYFISDKLSLLNFR